MIEISIDTFSVVIGFVLGLIVAGIIMITTALHVLKEDLKKEEE